MRLADATAAQAAVDWLVSVGYGPMRSVMPPVWMLACPPKDQIDLAVRKILTSDRPTAPSSDN